MRTWNTAGCSLAAIVLLLLPLPATAQQRGRRWLDAARDRRQRLEACDGLTVSGLLNAQSQIFVQDPDHRDADRHSVYYWMQLQQCLWTGACAIVEVEGGWGAGLDGIEPTYSFFDSDAGETAPLYIPKAYVSQYLADPSVSLNAGKLDLSSWFDVNDVANSGDIQFLSSALVNNLAIPFPQKGLGAMASFQPSDEFCVQAGLSDANAVTTHTGFDTAFEGDARAFSITELDWNPAFRAQPGHYRFILWNDQRILPRFDDGANETGHSGAALSFDQALTSRLTLFCRYGYEDPDVYPIEHFWSCGAQAKAILPKRPDDVFGFGVAQSILSLEHRRHGDDALAPSETLYELYYSIALFTHLAVSPVVQWDHNPLGEEKDVATAGARLVATF